MAKLEKRIGTMSVSISITNNRHSISLHGEVHPFIDRFYSARFQMILREHDFETEVGSGGSMHNLGDAARMMEATKVAHDLASYYKSTAEIILNRATDEKRYGHLLQRLFDEENAEALAEVLLLTPVNITKANVELALKMLNVNPILPGMEPTIATTLSRDFHRLPGVTIDAILTLIKHHPDFSVDDGDMVGPAVELLDRLTEDGILD